MVRYTANTARKMVTKKEKTKNSIKNWPKYECPRELLLEKGPDNVSDAGLIAVLLRSGTKGKDAVSLAMDLIKHFGGLRGLLNAKKNDLEKIKGLGIAKIAQLMAAIEITKHQLKEDIIGKNYIENDKDVMAIKTRIETKTSNRLRSLGLIIEELYPLKQGLNPPFQRG